MPNMDLTIAQPTMPSGPARRKPKLGRFHWPTNQPSVQFTGSNFPSHVGSSQGFLDSDPYSPESIQIGRAFSIGEQSASIGDPSFQSIVLKIRPHGPSYAISVEPRRSIGAVDVEFRELAARWRKATSFHSSLARKFMHDDYQSILAMGEPVIPLLLSELKVAPDHWFWALKHIAREDPAKDVDNVQDAAEAWLAWGRTKHYID